MVFEISPCRWTIGPSFFLSTDNGERVVSRRYVESELPMYQDDGQVCNRQSYDPWAVRDLFLEQRSEEDFLKFLNQTGCFFRPKRLEPGLFGYSAMQEWQKLVRVFMKLRPENWSKYIDQLYREHHTFDVSMIGRVLRETRRIPTEINWDRDKPSARMRLHDTVSALLTTIQLDHMRGVKYKFCARPDCRKPFRIRSAHNRIYCSQECGHLQSVRAVRERKRLGQKNAN